MPRGRSATRAPSQARPERIKLGIVCLFLTAIVWIAYGQMLRHDFINYDDGAYVTENVHVLNGLNWADLKWAFTTGHTGYAHPVTWLTHQLDYQLYGKWAGGHHLTSLLIHTVNSLLLFLFFLRTTRDFWPSAFIAALFAIHPLHVESVAWVAERKDVLSGFCFLLTLQAYAVYTARPQAWRYLLALGFFILGLLSKPMLVTVPCVLLLLDYWPLRRLTLPGSKVDSGQFNIGRLILEKVPFALIAGAWSLLTFVTQKKFGAVAAEAHLPVPLRIANGLVSYVIYVWNTIWPQNLALFYPYPSAWSLGIVIASAALLGLVSVLCIAKLRSSPYLIVGWLWYLGMLLPVIGFIQVGIQARADRYTYLPQIGLFVVVIWGTLELLAKWRRSREVLAVIALLAITALTTLSCFQVSYWRNSETLWHRSLAVTSGNYIAISNLGDALMKKGRLDEAISYFKQALAIQSSYPVLHNLGFVYAHKGNWAEAISFSQSAVGLRPNYPNARNNLAIILAEAGRKEEAIEQWREALRIDADYRDAHLNLANVLQQLNRRDEAVTHLGAALRLKPDDATVKAQLRQLGVEK